MVEIAKAIVRYEKTSRDVPRVMVITNSEHPVIVAYKESERDEP